MLHQLNHANILGTIFYENITMEQHINKVGKTV